MFKALTIAGSDSSGGAGIQADIKTFFAYNVYGMSAITAITAQNTQGVQAIELLPIEIIIQQIKSVHTDIEIDACKTGMLGTAEITSAIAATIKELKLKNLVVDPVMISKSGHALLDASAREVLIKELLPLAFVATPNLYEAEVILGKKIDTLAAMHDAAKAMADLGVLYPLIKGGHLESMPAIDILYDGRGFHEFKGERYRTKNTHGTGCTFSAAITALLARGETILEAVSQAKQFITKAIQTSSDIGHGHGPVNHFCNM